MQPGRRFFATLDGIRGVAAIAVVLAHAESLFGAGTAGENGLAVDVFFILSGVVVTNAYEYRLRYQLSVIEFINIRLIRLYPLYILGTAIGLFASLVTSTETDNLPFTITLAILMIPDLFVQALFPLNFPAWSLFFELWVNIVYAFTFRLLTLRVLAAIMAISALGLVGTLYFGNHHNIAGVGWTRTNVFGGFFRVGYSFFAGVLLYRLFASRKSARYRDWRKVIPWVILGLVAMTLCAKPPVMIEPYYEFVVVVLLSPAIIYCALWFEPMGAAAKICKFFGLISYAVYTVHVPLFLLYKYMIVRVTGLPLDNLTPWAGFCFIGILLPFCWALDKFYDSPLRGFLLAHGRTKPVTEHGNTDFQLQATNGEPFIKRDAA